MKLLIVVTLLAFAEANVINTVQKCVTLGVTAYEPEVLRTEVPDPYQLAIDHDTNTLFFSYTAKTTETFKMAYLSLKTNEFGFVDGIQGGFASAVDRISHIIYMGGEDGIYKFDYDTKSATNLNIKTDINIWQMFYKDGLYFTTYPDEKAFLYKNEELVEISKDKIMVLAVKTDGTYVYSNSSGLFTYNNITDTIVNIGDYVVNGFSSDIDGNIYFSTPSGIYYIDDKKNEIESIAKLDNVYGVAIEGDGNIIYASEDSIIRLKPSTDCFNELTEYKHVSAVQINNS